MERAGLFNPWRSWKVAILTWRLSSYIVPHPCVYWSFVQTQLFARNASLGQQTICLNLLLLLSSTHIGAWNNLPHPWKTNVPCSTCTIKTFQLKSRPSASWRNKRTSWFPTSTSYPGISKPFAQCGKWQSQQSPYVELWVYFQNSVEVLWDTRFMDLLERFLQLAQGTISVPLAVHKTWKPFPYIPVDS